MNEIAQTSRRGACPSCGEPMPFLKSQWRRGRSFACARCDRRIVLPKLSAGLVILLAALASFRMLPWPVLGALLIIATLLEWLYVRVRLADGDADASA
ncbi:MAG TPA: hypothetical protein VFZ91_10725 [Allosphingosinicella sp.]